MCECKCNTHDTVNDERPQLRKVREESVVAGLTKSVEALPPLVGARAGGVAAAVGRRYRLVDSRYRRTKDAIIEEILRVTLAWY